MSSASPIDRVVRFCLEQKLVVFLIVLVTIGWGVRVAPFDWELDWLERDPVAVDAIPDLGENQQIVFTRWPGRSPQDVEDQITYPLTVALLGVPGVRTVRSSSMFGFSSIFVIFEEDVEFYWSRSRVLERLSSLGPGTLPTEVQPALGPDATALGQVFWYTLEGRDPDGNPAGGWDPQELRSLQDWVVRYALASAEGVSEVASIGGFVREYQVDVDPDAMRAHGVTLGDVVQAVRMSNLDVGARTVEVNKVEYVVRGLGFLESANDLAQTVVKVTDNVPILVRDVASVAIGPALRRGALDKGGAEAVGGVVVVRYGFNPLAAIKNVKAEIELLSPGLPSKAVIDWTRADRAAVEELATSAGFEAYVDGELDQEAWQDWLRRTPAAEKPDWIALSQVTLVPFYDRTGLIYETLGTLSDALLDEILVTMIVVILMVMHLRSSILISGLLPLAVGMCFILMKLFGIDANIVALSGIAIAIGTMVDMGIVICENILRRLDEAGPEERSLEVVYRATSEVASAVFTAVATTVVGFLPVFAMTGSEGKLFRPLAFTKTFALIASVVVALTVLPAAAHLLFTGGPKRRLGTVLNGGLALAGAVLLGLGWTLSGSALLLFGLWHLVAPRLPATIVRVGAWSGNLLVVAVVLVMLAEHWAPLGIAAGDVRNLLFVGLAIFGLVLIFWLSQRVYARVLGWALAHKILTLSVPCASIVLGATVWLGWERVLGFVPDDTVLGQRGREAFPGLGREFMPRLDEGSYLLMPITMPHASIGEAKEVLSLQDRGIAAIPEVESVVGKLGRADSPLDPAPIGMIETVINYRPEYVTDKDGHPVRFRYDADAETYDRDADGQLIPDEDGRPFRQWRDHIHSPEDIWEEILAAAELPGTTSAPQLHPIEARLVMLQSGMRAPMGIKVLGPDLATIEIVGLQLERLLKKVPGVKAEAVIADRVVGKPYLEIDLDREAIARYGLHIRTVQDVIEVAVGGKPLTTTVEGRERYPVRVRYQRELRDDLDQLGRILVPTPDGAHIPLEQIAELRFVRGPQAIKSEDTALVSYVTFDKLSGWAEVDVIENCERAIEEAVESGEFVRPPGVRTLFAGTYENQIRAQKTLAVVLPLALLVIFLILYLQFRSAATTMIVGSGVLVAWSGGFLLLWLYGQPWFLDFDVLGTSMRSLFQIEPRNLSVAVWVGFLALFGIATDDGVVMATYLKQTFQDRSPRTVTEIRAATIAAGRRRIRPCLMTTATTLLALMPVLTSTGRGSDILVPMAIPSVGGMAIEIVTMLVVPVLFCWVQEMRARFA